MVALAAFVVVSHVLVSMPHLGQAVLEAMLAWRHRRVKLSDHDFDEGPGVADFLRTRE
jgi:hypothetical protein